jgi:hypothetical protein
LRECSEPTQVEEGKERREAMYSMNLREEERREGGRNFLILTHPSLSSLPPSLPPSFPPSLPCQDDVDGEREGAHEARHLHQGLFRELRRGGEEGREGGRDR